MLISSLAGSTGMIDIANTLNARRHDPRLIAAGTKTPSTTMYVGLTAEKYAHKTDSFFENVLGMRITRPTGRALVVSYEVVDDAKFASFAGDRTPLLIPMRPKDMPVLLAKGLLDVAMTYETVMCNMPTVATEGAMVVDADIHLALIGRPDFVFTPAQWSQKRKLRIASEHPWHVARYLRSLGMPDDAFTLTNVLGGSESYVAIGTKFDLCDSLVESGATLRDNKLAEVATVLEKGTIRYGLWWRISH